MDLRITPLANFSPAKKCSPGYAFRRNRGTVSNQDNTPSLPAPAKTKKSVLLLPANKLKQPTALLKISSPHIQTTSPLRNKSAMMLYQQIENNKMFTNGAELVNRFHYRV